MEGCDTSVHTDFMLTYEVRTDVYPVFDTAPGKINGHNTLYVLCHKWTIHDFTIGDAVETSSETIQVHRRYSTRHGVELESAYSSGRWTMI